MACIACCFSFVSVCLASTYWQVLFACIGAAQQQLGSWPLLSGGMTLPVFSTGAGLLGDFTALSSQVAGDSSGGMPPMSSSGQLGLLTRLPRKLCEKISALEFVEMNELLPETWSAVTAVDAGVIKLPSRRSPVTDIVVWTECYAMMSAVLVERYPIKAPHLFAYLRRIARAARSFRGPAWVAYDRMFRRQALARRSLDWGIEDPGLYSEAFVGQAQAVARCTHCLSELHSAEACPDLPRFVGLSVQQAGSSAKSGSSSRDVCKKFNEGRCNHRPCRFLHLCMACNKPHPVTRCPSAGRQHQQPRERSPSKKGRQ